VLTGKVRHMIIDKREENREMYRLERNGHEKCVRSKVIIEKVKALGAGPQHWETLRNHQSRPQE